MQAGAHAADELLVLQGARVALDLQGEALRADAAGGVDGENERKIDLGGRGGCPPQFFANSGRGGGVERV
jgi:hypothetical protein